MWDSAGKIDTYASFSKASRLALKQGLNPSAQQVRFKCGTFIKSAFNLATAHGDCAVQT